MVREKRILSVEKFLDELRVAETIVGAFREMPGIVQAQVNEQDPRFKLNGLNRPDVLALILHGEDPQYETEDFEGVDLFAYEYVSPQNAARVGYAVEYFGNHLRDLPFLVVGHEFQLKTVKAALGALGTSTLALIRKRTQQPHLRAHLQLFLEEAIRLGYHRLQVVISDLQFVRARGYCAGCFRELLREHRLVVTFVPAPWLVAEQAGTKEILEECVKIARDLQAGHVCLES